MTTSITIIPDITHTEWKKEIINAIAVAMASVFEKNRSCYGFDLGLAIGEMRKGDFRDFMPEHRIATIWFISLSPYFPESAFGYYYSGNAVENAMKPFISMALENMEAEKGIE